MLDISASKHFAVLKVEESPNEQRFYVLMYNMQPESYINALFGGLYEVVKDGVLYKLTTIDASKVVSFSCGVDMTTFVNKPTKDETSGFSEKGWTYAYKIDDEWQLMTGDEYASKKEDLPTLSLAIKFPIANF